MMANWVQNYLQLEGPEEEISRFRQALDGKECCGRTLCVHALLRLAFDGEEIPAWAKKLRLVDEDPFDEANRAYCFYSAWDSFLLLVPVVSNQFPSLTFYSWACDLSAGCGYEYHLVEIRTKNRETLESYHTHWTEYEKDNINESIPITSFRNFLQAVYDPVDHWKAHGPRTGIQEETKNETE